MALMQNRPGAMMRRATMWSLVGSVVLGLIVGVVIAHIVGFIVFVLGLVITALLWFNYRTVARTRGTRY